ncbi:hypothetical protein N0B31_02835 [Salinirubellus salinus]|uniref:Uncharacterized protein n=1 Tax=Salinirubellus salinus TaxID=1364945 RepID=A0A9E7R427_9EURY|nr:hypothetical protein [Salinirubellus salinus]UWM55227.1 hypothetical protein N0B31_02835 [Salinirubellus salinus]
MSEAQRRLRLDVEDLENPVCDYCGVEIEEDEQRCEALDDGRCSP